MKYFLYVILGFFALFYFWYITGGPLRDSSSKPFVITTEKGGIKYIDKEDLKNK